MAASGFYSVSRGVQLATQVGVVALASALAIPAGRAGLFLGSACAALAAGTVWLLPAPGTDGAAAALARQST
jgi:hypothetical protein